jgi:hypothetical protein
MKTNRNKNAMPKTILCLPLAALLITAAVAGPAAAWETLAFEGAIEGTENFTFFDPPVDGVDLNIIGAGGGTNELLGQFTATWDGDITFANPDSSVIRTFTAENGDEIWSEGLAAGTPPDPNQTVVGNYEIIGGTGLFDGATGSYTVERTVFNVAPPFMDLATTGTFSGTIKTVPEPTGFVLATICLPVLSFFGWRRRRLRRA